MVTYEKVNDPRVDKSRSKSIDPLSIENPLSWRLVFREASAEYYLSSAAMSGCETLKELEGNGKPGTDST